jgi:hypothetical protein
MRPTTRITIIAFACLAIAGLAGCSGKTVTSSTPPATVTTTTSAAPAPTETVTTTPSVSPTTGGGASACTSANLTAAVVANPGGGTAGSIYYNLVLTNTGTASCTLQGWPGVSFVGDGNGTQLGQAAAFDKTSPHPTVTLAPAGKATSTLRVVRVYPPGQKASLFASTTGLTGCASTSVSLLTVSGLQ